MTIAVSPYFLDSDSFIDNMKRAAKYEKRASNQNTHTFYLDKIAQTAGFHGWALLQRKLKHMYTPEFEQLVNGVNSGIAKALPNTAQKYVINDLRGFLKSSFETLAEFSVPDPNSGNGYSHPSIDLRSEVMDAYGSIYPAPLLDVAINELEKEGPWCIDDAELILDFEPVYYSDL